MNGKTINGYTLQRQLGVGGMAEVWLAENAIEKQAAVKILLPKFCADEAIVARFQNEAKVMVKLDHPNIRQVYDYGSIDGRPAIVMEYLEGDDLKALMKRGRRFTDEELRKWWNQIADALNYTHAQGIVHRDIKPSNIFLDKKGNVKLLDFGIAKIRESISMTQTGAMMGTLMYMSPEQVKDSKHIGPQSDVYSLAVTFVHLLSGKRPYDSDTMSDYEIRKGIVEIPLDLSAVPENWRGFLAPYLAKKPEDRPALRAFEMVAETPKTMQPHVDDETVANDVGLRNTRRETPSGSQPDDTVSSSNPHSGPSFRENGTRSPEPKDNPKSKKVLWIGLGVAIVAAVAVLLYVTAKSHPVTVEPNPGTAEPNPGTAEPNPKCSISYSGTTMIVSVGDVTFNMINVEGGTFMMGSNDTDLGVWDTEKPAHNVTLSTYYIGETEVTQALWKAVMGSNPSYFIGDNLPVEQVSWNDCQEFISKLNQLTGQNFRLPTEAEWEYAARGGKKSNHYNYAGSNNIEEVAWYNGNSGEQTHPVKEKKANELGLYDMTGNVDEWCGDFYEDYSSDSQTNPTGPSFDYFRVLRFGGWNDIDWDSRVSFRFFADPGDRKNELGFRLALSQ